MVTIYITYRADDYQLLGYACPMRCGPGTDLIRGVGIAVSNEVAIARYLTFFGPVSRSRQISGLRIVKNPQGVAQLDLRFSDGERQSFVLRPGCIRDGDIKELKKFERIYMYEEDIWQDTETATKHY